jgi:ubiquinone/menaquinone biosynthesis C-methylase UbiE
MHQRLVKVASRHYDEWAHWMKSVPWYNDARIHNQVISWLPRRFSTGVELCCGSGQLLNAMALARPSTKWIGIDISKEMISLAWGATEGRNNVDLVVGDWTQLIDKKANVIVVKNALHISSEDQISQIKRVASINPRLIVVETISPCNESKEWGTILFGYTKQASIKQRLWTWRSLLHMIEESGWKVNQFRFIPQFVDVMEWLQKKCPDKDHMDAAVFHFQSANRNIRKRLCLQYDKQNMPTKILRLQCLLSCVKN